MSRKAAIIAAGVLTAAAAGTATIAYRRHKNDMKSHNLGEIEGAAGIVGGAEIPKGARDATDATHRMPRKAKKKKLAASSEKH